MSKLRGEARKLSAVELRRVLSHQSETGDERRRDKRLPMRLAIDIRLSRGDLPTLYTENISEGGLMFAVAPPVSLPSTVTLRLQLPNGDAVELTGDVRHVDRKIDRIYVGVQFSTLSAEVRRKFEEALLTSN